MIFEIDKDLLSRFNNQEDVEMYISQWCVCNESLHSVMNNILVEKGLTLSDLMKRSNINKNYGYNILNGRRTNPSRDKILALCLGAGLSVEETQNVLLLSKVGGLYCKCERDVWIAFALNSGLSDVLEVNIMLEKKGIEPLDV